MSDWYGGQEQEIEALGKTWRLSRQTRHVWREFALWAKSVLPDPIEAVSRHIDALGLKDAEIVRTLMKQDAAEKEAATQEKRPPIALADKFIQYAETLTSKALDKAASYLNFGGPELLSLMTCPEGQVRMLWLLLKKHNPDITEDTADDIANEIGPRRMAVVFKTAAGHVPRTEKNGEGREE